MARLRVMVVDDSAVIRGFLTRFISEDPDMEVVAAADNGARALQLLEGAAPDVVVLDVDMPVMDGLTALPLLLEKRPGLRVIVSSAGGAAAAQNALRCLQLGAVEYLPKPAAQDMAAAAHFRQALLECLRALGGLAAPETGAAEPVPACATPSTAATAPLAPEALAICCSTGGPQALLTLFRGWQGELRQPVLITQHMPAQFTAVLADNLAAASGLPCAEAQDNEPLLPGRLYVAPGDYHMTVTAGHRIALTQSPPENFCRPSADPMLRSLAAAYGPRLLTLVLTGMGLDGVAGCRAAVAAGGGVIAQDEASSVVWGMPGAVARAGLCRRVLPLETLARELPRYLLQGLPC